MTQRFQDPRVNVVKGILILVIVAGHNESLSWHFQDARKFFYYFNVQAFLLLVFLFPAVPLTVQAICDRVVRYLVPYVVFSLLAAVLYCAVFAPPPQIFNYLLGLFTSLVSGNESALNETVGLRLFWFLPSLLSLVYLRALAAKSRRWYRSVLVMACLGLVMLLLMEIKPLAYFPMGFALALAFYPMGVVVEKFLATRLKDTEQSASLFVVAVFGVLIVLLLLKFMPLGWVAGASLEGFYWRDPLTLVAALCLPVLILIVLFGVSGGLKASSFLCFCGKGSLVIYLVHMFFYNGLVFFLWRGNNAGFRENLSAGVAVFIVTLVLSLIAARGLSYCPRLRDLVFPRDWMSWKKAIIKSE